MNPVLEHIPTPGLPTPASSGLPAELGLSVGVAEVPSGTRDILASIQEADTRMYQDRRRRAALAVLVIAGSRPSAQSRPLVAPEAALIYQRLLPQISRIKIFDHHAHPGFADDAEVDPAPVPPSTPPVRLREDNPDWVAAARAGDYFSIAGASVLNLEPVLRDPRYSSTTFVLIHGGHPFDVPAIFMTSLKNVWLDSSATGSFVLFPDELKNVLRRWFELWPEKVTYGSDAFPMDDRIGAEELYWFGVHNARTAAAAALAEMVAAREITESQAMRIARGYLHDNAAALYK